MENNFASRDFGRFPATNDLNLPHKRQGSCGKGKTINPHDVRGESNSDTAVNMVSKSSVSAQTRSVEFYCFDDDEPDNEESSIAGPNLLVQHGLEHAYQKFFGKKTKESLSSFLTHLPGLIDVPGTPNDGLQALISKPPIGGKELIPLSGHQLAGFRLNPGPVPDQFKFVNQQPSKKKHKHKKHKKEHGDSKVEDKAKVSEGTVEKKAKKSKKHEDGEKKKKKKEKRKKKDKTTDPVT